MGGADRLDRIETLAARRPVRLGRVNLSVLVVRAARRFVDVRVTGLAAEMTYYALISLLPLTTAVGAALGFLERVLGGQRVQEIEATFVRGLTAVFDHQLASDVLAPLAEGLLRQERAGVAVGSLASRCGWPAACSGPRSARSMTRTWCLSAEGSSRSRRWASACRWAPS